MSEFWSACLSFFGDMLLLCMTATFLENTIFSRALGTSTALFTVRKQFNLFLLGLIMTAVITVSAAATYFVFPLIKRTGQAYYLMPMVCVLIIGFFYAASLVVTAKFVKKRRREVQSIIHVSVFNCAVLGSLLLMVNGSDLSLGGFIGFGIGTGLGFTIASYFVKLAYEQLSSERVPYPFRGFPITLIYIGIASLAIYGLIGHELPF